MTEKMPWAKTLGKVFLIVSMIVKGIFVLPVVLGIISFVLQKKGGDFKNRLIASIIACLASLVGGAFYLLHTVMNRDIEISLAEPSSPKEEVKQAVEESKPNAQVQQEKAKVAQEAQLQHSKIMVEEAPKAEGEVVTAPKKSHSGRRLAVYAGIIGGLAVTSLTLFYVSQFEKVKRTEAQSIVTQATSKLKKANKVLSSIQAIDLSTVDDEKKAELAHEEEVAKQHVYYWEQVVKDFEAETYAVGVKFMVACIPAYLFSMGTLVSVGLILKHAEKVKEKEDEAV